MYHTARTPETALSRSELPVCITRLAMRPAKSSWKNGQLWRTTCQWFCQRTKLVKAPITALKRSRLSNSKAAGRKTNKKTNIRPNMGPASRSAASRSIAIISPTNLPIKSGMTVSLSATNRQLSSIAKNKARDWRKKCQ